MLCGSAFAQNTSAVSGSNITDLNGTKLAAGSICFLGTDGSDNPISFQVGGGGQALRRGYCSPVTTGVITGFSIPTPAATLPAGIYYRVTVKDSSNGQEVLRYTGVTFAGATFNFDSYAPVLSGGSFAPLTGTSVSGNLSVAGNAAVTGTVTGSNIPAGTITTTSNNLSVFAATTSVQLAGVISDETGTGAAVFATSPTLVTPVLGAATATTINKVALTQPASTATLTLTSGATLTGQATGTVVNRDSTDTLTNKTLVSASSGNHTTILCPVQNNLSPVVGTGADIPFVSCTINQNVVPTGGVIKIFIGWKHSTGTGTITYHMNLGGVILSNYGAIADALTTRYSLQTVIINLGTTVAKSDIDITANTNGNVASVVNGVPSYATALAVDMSSANRTLTFSFNAANTEQVTPEIFFATVDQ